MTNKIIILLFYIFVSNYCKEHQINRTFETLKFGATYMISLSSDFQFYRLITMKLTCKQIEITDEYFPLTIGSVLSFSLSTVIKLSCGLNTFNFRKDMLVRKTKHVVFTNSAPLSRVGHRVAMSMCLFVCLRHRVQFFSLGLSLALRSHDQFQASHWSSLPPSLGNLETR